MNAEAHSAPLAATTMRQLCRSFTDVKDVLTVALLGALGAWAPMETENGRIPESFERYFSTTSGVTVVGS
jgi:hypothetical protein